MKNLDSEKYYELTADELSKLQAIFAADFCTDEEGLSYIKQAFDQAGYLMCPHTATCFKAYDTCREDKSIKTIAYSTAEWTKFSPVIANALTGETFEHDIDALNMIAKKANIKIPTQIAALFDKEIAHKTVIDKRDIEKEILSFLGS
jgi:threonine synthase